MGFILGALKETSVTASRSNTTTFVRRKSSFAGTPIRWVGYYACLEEKKNAQPEGVLPL
jgi:hypothetical protein